MNRDFLIFVTDMSVLDRPHVGTASISVGGHAWVYLHWGELWLEKPEKLIIDSIWSINLHPVRCALHPFVLEEAILYVSALTSMIQHMSTSVQRHFGRMQEPDMNAQCCMHACRCKHEITSGLTVWGIRSFCIDITYCADVVICSSVRKLSPVDHSPKTGNLILGCEGATVIAICFSCRLARYQFKPTAAGYLRSSNNAGLDELCILCRRRSRGRQSGWAAYCKPNLGLNSRAWLLYVIYIGQRRQEFACSQCSFLRHLRNLLCSILFVAARFAHQVFPQGPIIGSE